ncbi:MAG TPA: hypothetical protein VHO23_02455 [Candidatus Paceibacterota bacterium]|nr:hypothetical protein [Candidatus Paceibacterota bacterium]
MAVEFNEEQQLPTRRRKAAAGLARLVMKSGIVRTERDANIVLLVVALALIAFAVWLLLSQGPGSNEPVPVPNENWPTLRG